MNTQLTLFDQPPPQQTWTERDIWTPAWNQAIDLAIITACSDKWMKLKDMIEIAAAFGLKVTDTPFSAQVVHLGNTGRLKVNWKKKIDTAEWSAV